MKKIFVYGAAMLVSAMTASCLGDLDTLPLNETDFTSEKAYENPDNYAKGMSYIYGYFGMVSQGDPGKSDLEFDDAGKSELLRQWWTLQEAPTDSWNCIWGDDYVTTLQYDTWTSADNNGIVAVYTRCLKGITLANEYFIQTADGKLGDRGHGAYADQVHGYRAEVRFLRALYYYMLLDCFGNPPFATEANIGGDLPRQIGRTALYEWIENELKELTEDPAMPDYGAVPYPRATKGSVWALLARLRLNAEVYTGKADWSGAKEAAEKVIGMGYELCKDYGKLFMMDNGTNGAQKEFVFSIYYDKDFMQSWGGTTHLLSGSLDQNANEVLGRHFGVEKINVENWAGYHVSDQYVSYFDLQGVVWGQNEGLGYDREKSDRRAFFINANNTKELDKNNLNTGWLCWKFNGRYSDGKVVTDGNKFSSVDFPMFRLAEMYLIQAECEMRMGNGALTGGEAYNNVKKLRERAKVDMPVSIDLDWLLEERAREFMWEAQRRMDLIRFGKFLTAQFPWPYKGNVADGKITLDDRYLLYPIIVSDLNANPTLEQNKGY